MEINNEEVKFPADAEIRIAVSGSSGGGGFGGTITNDISINDGLRKNTFSEKTLHGEDTPITNFIIKNPDLFEVQSVIK